MEALRGSVIPTRSRIHRPIAETAPIYRGSLLQPASAADAVQELEDLSSLIASFIEDRCRLGPEYHIERRALFEAWVNWCKTQGRDHPGTIESLGRDLRAAIPTLKTSNLRTSSEKRLRFYEGIGLR